MSSRARLGCGKIRRADGGDADSATHLGWTAGAGVEWALSSRFSLKLEYLSADYGHKKYFGGEKLDPEMSTMRFGVNYRSSTR